MSWDLILQVAALVLLGGIAVLIAIGAWNAVADAKHKRNLELIEHRERASRKLNAELDALGRAEDV